MKEIIAFRMDANIGRKCSTETVLGGWILFSIIERRIQRYKGPDKYVYDLHRPTRGY